MASVSCLLANFWPFVSCCLFIGVSCSSVILLISTMQYTLKCDLVWTQGWMAKSNDAICHWWCFCFVDKYWFESFITKHALLHRTTGSYCAAVTRHTGTPLHTKWIAMFSKIFWVVSCFFSTVKIPCIVLESFSVSCLLM